MKRKLAEGDRSLSGLGLLPAQAWLCFHPGSLHTQTQSIPSTTPKAPKILRWSLTIPTVQLQLLLVMIKMHLFQSPKPELHTSE